MVRWSPFSDMEDIDRFFEGFAPVRAFKGMKTYFPAVDVYQDKDNVTVEAELPGISPENVKVSVENDVLRLEGSSEKKTEIDEKNFYRKEVRSGSFHRAIPLPAAVNGAQAEASYEGGILKVVIPKEERAKPKTIKVRVKDK
jgi:HSP20 family protein